MKKVGRVVQIVICAIVLTVICLSGCSCISLDSRDEDTNDPAPSVILLRISVAEPPEKTAYVAGESFEPDGMSIMAHYSNGTRQRIEAYSYSPGGALSVRDVEIVISYEDKFVKQKISVNLGLVYESFIDNAYNFEGMQKVSYEAENALVPGRILMGDRKNYPDTSKLNGASNDAWLGNTGFSDNWVEFSIKSDRQTKAVCELVLACSFFWVFEPIYGGNIPMENLSLFIDITILGCPVDLSGIRLEPGLYHKDDTLNTAWTNWSSLIIEDVQLVEGENVLRVSVKPFLDENGEILRDPVWNSPVYRCPSLDVLNVWTA